MVKSHTVILRKFDIEGPAMSAAWQIEGQISAIDTPDAAEIRKHLEAIKRLLPRVSGH